jgi:hypothetical protein
MRALLSAADLKIEVPHFKSEKFYVALMKGEEYVSKRRGRRFEAFEFEDDTGAVHRLPKRPRKAAVAKGKKVPKKKRIVSSADGSSSTQSSSSSSSSSSASSSSSSPPRSSSSSSSSLSSGVKTPDVVVPIVVAPIVAAIVPVLVIEPLKDLSEHVTLFWKTFKFTPTKDVLGNHTGWECTCYILGHKIPGKTAMCRWTLKHRVEGGLAQTERRLKDWALGGFGCMDRPHHYELKGIRDEMPPSMDELDAFVVPDWHLDERGLL